MWKKRTLCLLLLLFLCSCTQTQQGHFRTEPISVSTTAKDFKITCTLDSTQRDRRQPFPLEVRIDYLGEESAIPVWGRSSFSHVQWDVAMDDAEMPNIWLDTGRKYVFSRNSALVERHDAAYLYEQYGRFSPGNYTAIVDVEFSLDEAHAEAVKAHFEIPFVVEGK